MFTSTRKLRGFSLIELMIVISIIGVLAAIAIPSYQNYVTKARVARAFELMDEIKQSVEIYYNENGQLPPCCGTGSGGPATINSPNGDIGQIYYWSPISGPGASYATIEAWFMPNAIPDTTNNTIGPGTPTGGRAFEFQVVVSKDGLTWTCGPHPYFNSIGLEYLPPSCHDTITLGYNPHS